MEYKWVVVALLSFVGALNYADRTVLSAVYPLLKEDLGMSEYGFAGLGTVFLWSYALASPFAGVIGDRQPRRSIILSCLTAWSVVTLLASFVGTTEQLLGMRMLLGLAEALYIPASTALISEFHDFRTRGIAMAIHVAGMSVGAVCGGTYGGYIGELYGWRPAMLSLGAAGLILVVICHFVLAKDGPEGNGSAAELSPSVGRLAMWPTIVSVLNVPVCAILFAQAVMLSIGTLIFTHWLPFYFRETFGMSLGSSGFAGTAAINFGSILGVLGGGWLSDWAARKGARYRLIVQSMMYFAAVPFLVLFLVSNQLDVITFSIFAFSVFRTIGQSSEVPALCDNLPSDRWATAMGLLNAGNCLAGGLAILLSAYLLPHLGLKLIFFGSSSLIVISALLLLLGYNLTAKNLRVTALHPCVKKK